MINGITHDVITKIAKDSINVFKNFSAAFTPPNTTSDIALVTFEIAPAIKFSSSVFSAEASSVLFFAFSPSANVLSREKLYISCISFDNLTLKGIAEKVTNAINKILNAFIKNFLLSVNIPNPNIPIAIGPIITNTSLPINVIEYFSKNNTIITINIQSVRDIRCSAIGVPVSSGINVIAVDIPAVNADNLITFSASSSRLLIVLAYWFGDPAEFKP